MTLTLAERTAKHDAQRTLRRINRRERQEAKKARPKQVSPVAAGQRDPRQKNGAYLSALRTAPCLFCAIAARVQVARTEAAHVKTGYPEAGRGWRHFGVQEKSHDWRALPSCTTCHREGRDAQHNHSEAAWYAERGRLSARRLRCPACRLPGRRGHGCGRERPGHRDQRPAPLPPPCSLYQER